MVAFVSYFIIIVIIITISILTASQIWMETSAFSYDAVVTRRPARRNMLTAGVDLGTSGARLSIVQIDPTASSSSSSSSSSSGAVERFASSLPWKDGQYDDPAAWLAAVTTLLRRAAAAVDDDISTLQSLCISGTSASCLVVDVSTTDLSLVVRYQPRMYDYAVSSKSIEQVLIDHAPARHTTLSPTSSLSKLLDWHLDSPLASHHRLLHQADYVTMNLLADRSATYSDWHNCLKLGYDVRRLEWPLWLRRCLGAVHLDTNVLPARVVAPGATIGPIDPVWARDLGLPESCTLTAGTTDSNAAFMAAGTAGRVGAAVTSLGSTLAIKQLSAVYVEDSTRGVYSHRFPSQQKQQELWLVGGASNVGCAVLRQQNYTDDELVDCSNKIDPTIDSLLNYYPLTKNGERFPISDPNKKSVLEPVPEDRTEFLHGILQGISNVERDGYLALTALGASPPTTILTAGGGSRNPMWTEMRQRKLREVFPNVTVKVAANTQASFGAALLAASELKPYSRYEWIPR
jgi:D-ribulokinase